jgi:hypothetical protein
MIPSETYPDVVALIDNLNPPEDSANSFLAYLTSISGKKQHPAAYSPELAEWRREVVWDVWNRITRGFSNVTLLIASPAWSFSITENEYWKVIRELPQFYHESYSALVLLAIYNLSVITPKLVQDTYDYIKGDRDIGQTIGTVLYQRCPEGLADPEFHIKLMNQGWKSKLVYLRKLLGRYLASDIEAYIASSLANPLRIKRVVL